MEFTNYQDVFSLENRVVLVAGGSSGIGRGCANVLAQAGASVLVVGTRQHKLDRVQSEIVSAGGVCETFAGDLSREENCQAMVEACLEKFGHLDVLVNSAGITGSMDDLEAQFQTDNFNKTMGIDFNATFFAIKYAYPELKKSSHGSIINIASIAALAARGPVVYSAAKGAVRSLSRHLAKDFGPSGVRINSIYPGMIITEMTSTVLENPELEAHFKADSPMGLLGFPEDIGYLALYLASDASRYVTGQDFVIDGGATC
jgi:NAD(P)-dependent dehydrogenase (short-subunit alcohol dehydrogenase family)